MTGSAVSVDSLGELGDRTTAKVKWRVLPLIVFLYFIAFLDRNNLGDITAATYDINGGLQIS